jgi:S1-C subfamily serine protease
VPDPPPHAPPRSCVDDLTAVLDDRRPGDRVKVDIVRDGKATSLTVVLGERGSLGFTEE